MDKGISGRNLASAAEVRTYLDELARNNSAAAYKEQQFELLEAAAGLRILDLGCGTGADLQAIASRLDGDCELQGVDISPDLVGEAERRAAAAGVSIAFTTADAQALPFAAQSFDRCRIDRMLMHVPAPDRVLREVHRILVPGGRLVVSEPDWETVTIRHPDRDLTRTVLNYLTDAVVERGWIGRELPDLLGQAGLRVAAVRPFTVLLPDYPTANQLLQLERTVTGAAAAGRFDAEVGNAWLEELADLDAADRFFASITVFAVAGNAPAANTPSA